MTRRQKAAEVAALLHGFPPAKVMRLAAEEAFGSAPDGAFFGKIDWACRQLGYPELPVDLEQCLYMGLFDRSVPESFTLTTEEHKTMMLLCMAEIYEDMLMSGKPLEYFNKEMK
jgi:hypothetical protein